MAGWVPAVQVGQDNIEISSDDQRAGGGGEEGGENIRVEAGALGRRGGSVHPDDADRSVVKPQIHPQDPAARYKGMDKFGWAAEVQPGTEDDGHAFGRSGARHKKSLHAGPDGSPSCRDLEEIERVRGHVRLREDRSVRCLLP